MKYKSTFKRLKAQNGILNDPQFFSPNSGQPNFNWLTEPSALNPAGITPGPKVTAEGTPTSNNPKIVPLERDQNGNVYSVNEQKVKEGTGRYVDNPYVKEFNYAASAVTGIANMIQNNRLKNKEQDTLLHSLEPAYFQNMEGEGLNNLPMYTQYGGATNYGSAANGGPGGFGPNYDDPGFAHEAFYGDISIPSGAHARQYGGYKPRYAAGGLTAQKAAEILHDGTVHGKPITDAQRKFFGWVAGGRKQGGGNGQDQIAQIVQLFAQLQGQDPNEIMAQLQQMQPQEQQQAIQQMVQAIQAQQGQQQAQYGCDDCDHEMKAGGKWIPHNLKKGRCANPGSEDCPKGSPQYKLAMTFKKHHGFHKSQTGTSVPPVVTAPAEPAPLSPQEQYYQSSATLSHFKNILNDKLKAKNPQAFQDYFKGLVDLRRKNDQPGASNYVQNTAYNDYLSPQEVQSTLGAENYQKYLQSLQAVNTYDVSQGRQPLYGQVEGENDITKLNYGRRFASLQLTPSFGASNTEGSKRYSRQYTYNPSTGNVDYSETGDTSLRPDYLSTKQAGGNWIQGAIKHPGRCANPGDANCPEGSPQYNLAMRFKHGDLHKKAGGVPNVYGLPDEFDQMADVEAEAGEIIQKQDGGYVKVADNANTHEQGGEMIPNVKRVLEDTGDKRKDKASKILKVSPEAMQDAFGIKIKSPVTHAKAFEIANEELNKSNKQYDTAKKDANLRENLDKTALNTLRMNKQFQGELPTEDDIFNLLFLHQEGVKQANGINDDGSMAKYGGHKKKKMAAYQTGGKWMAGAVNPAHKGDFTALAKKHGMGVQEFANHVLANNEDYSTHVVNMAKFANSAGNIAKKQTGGLKGKENVNKNLKTPKGNPNQVTYPGGLPALVDKWKDVIPGIENVTDPEQFQKITYDYLLKNQPDLIDKTIWAEGLNRQGINMYKSGKNKAFNEAVGRAFDPKTFAPKPGYSLTQADREALGAAYPDKYLMNRLVVPDVTTNTTADANGNPVTPAQGASFNPNVNVNPRIIQQPSNRFHEPTYWSDVAAPLAGFVDSFGRSPELYNPAEFHQLQYKLLDPTAALTANQADFNAAVDESNNMNTGVGNANKANLIGQKYRANNQVLSNYENQNVGIKNREIDYNTQVRDKQSIADAQSRGEFYRNVLLGREAQRQQKLTSLAELARIDQLKRRQNASGNLLLKLSPAFNQLGEYNGYQYSPYLDPSMVNYNENTQPIQMSSKKSKTSSTTTWKDAAGTIHKTTTNQ